jgi:hypothetical protein
MPSNNLPLSSLISTLSRNPNIIEDILNIDGCLQFVELLHIMKPTLQLYQTQGEPKPLQSLHAMFMTSSAPASSLNTSTPSYCGRFFEMWLGILNWTSRIYNPMQLVIYRCFLTMVQLVELVWLNSECFFGYF